MDQPVSAPRLAQRFPDLRPQPVAQQRRESIATNNVQMVANHDPIQQRNESVVIGVQVDIPQPVQQRHESASIGVQVDPSNIDADNEIWCICRNMEYGEMIQCDSNICVIGWFHLDCMKMKTAPEDDWYCPNCQFFNNEA